MQQSQVLEQSHTKSWVYCNVGQDLQEMLQFSQCGRSKGLHLRVQIIRWLLEGKRQIKMEAAFRAHMPCRSGRLCRANLLSMKVAVRLLVFLYLFLGEKKKKIEKRAILVTDTDGLTIQMP